jgi:hypothetical protein
MVSVELQLGLHGGDNGLLEHAEENWASWTDRFPCLPGIGGVGSLRGWLRTAEPAAADEVLHALVTLASPTGGDDRSAAALVAWAMLPGASLLAQRLRTLSPRIDEVVAAQLWIEIRTFPWQRLRKVAANILASTRTGVLRECGAHRQIERVDRTWSSARLVDPTAVFWTRVSTQNNASQSAAPELVEVLEWARALNVISDSDRSLLLSLAETADSFGPARTGRGWCGLMANDLSADVAHRLGISPITVRRRARKAISALADACAANNNAARAGDRLRDRFGLR